MSIRLNIGCGPNPTAGWRNYDNSGSIRLARRPVLQKIFGAIGFIGPPQWNVIRSAEANDIRWANVVERIPEPDDSIAAIYSSHMFEHLERDAVQRALRECYRVLHSGGVLRISVPDVRYYVDQYLQDGDANDFIEHLMLAKAKPKSLRGKLRYLLVGDRHHQWMYDGKSLCNVVSEAGFTDPRVMGKGETRIPDPGALNLLEREVMSVIVEALKP